MKKIISVIAGLLLTASIFAQAPQNMSYQAVIRNSSDVLIVSTTVGMQISILQGSANGSAVYAETQTPTSNTNGLVSLEIGAGTVVSGDFTTIDWSAGPYFIKTETDPTGGTSYSITGTSQLLSVPYALHAKTAETVIGAITEIDPVFIAWDKSTGISITESQISDLDHFTTADEIDPVFTAWDRSTGISITESQISDLDHFTIADEIDPVFTAWDKSIGISITESQISDLDHFTIADEIDPVFTSWDKSTGISITESQISDLDHFTTADEIDPVFTAWDKSTGISITESQISDLDHFTTADETDPSVPSGIQTGEMQYWDGTTWVTVAPGSFNQTLHFCNGSPTWGPCFNDVLNPATGNIWMDRNLGASQVATSSTDAASYGDLYQWGRLTDGHQMRTSGTTSTLSPGDTPGHANFILAPSNPNDWHSPQNDNLWQGVSGVNNPCPTGYRLPTEAEFNAERLSWSTNNAAGAFASPLKLPVAGDRGHSNGILFDVGSQGQYWSSTVSGANSLYLIFSSSDAISMYSIFRAVGFSVRCLKD